MTSTTNDLKNLHERTTAVSQRLTTASENDELLHLDDGSVQGTVNMSTSTYDDLVTNVPKALAEYVALRKRLVAQRDYALVITKAHDNQRVRKEHHELRQLLDEILKGNDQ